MISTHLSLCVLCIDFSLFILLCEGKADRDSIASRAEEREEKSVPFPRRAHRRHPLSL